MKRTYKRFEIEWFKIPFGIGIGGGINGCKDIEFDLLLFFVQIVITYNYDNQV